MTCSGQTRAGTPCRAPVVGSSSWCLSHHPDLAEKVREGRRKGGRAAKATRDAQRRASAGPAQPRLRTPEERLDVVERLLADTIALPNCAQRNRTGTALVEAAERIASEVAMRERLEEVKAMWERLSRSPRLAASTNDGGGADA